MCCCEKNKLSLGGHGVALTLFSPRFPLVYFIIRSFAVLHLLLYADFAPGEAVLQKHSGGGKEDEKE